MNQENDGFAQTYGNAVKAFASVTAVSAFLLLFGFLSESALYQYTGLPQLSADYVGLVEAGARAIVDSISTMGAVRAGVLLGLLLLVRWLWARPAELRYLKYLQMPAVMTAAQTAILIAAALLFAAFVEIADLASPRGQEHIRERGQSLRAELRTRQEWSALSEVHQVESLTYIPRSLSWFLLLDNPDNRLCRGAAPGSWRERFSCPESGASDTLLGLPVRMTHEARAGARDVYGFLLFAVMLLATAAVLLRQWRRWLSGRYPLHWSDRSRASTELIETVVQYGPGKERAAEVAMVMKASSKLIEPVLLVLSLGCLMLLPTAYGVLGRESVGLQQVVLRLKGNDACNAGKLTEVTEKNEGESPGATMAGSSCDAESLKEIEKAVRDYRVAWRELIQTRPAEKEYGDVVEQYRQKVDNLMRDGIARSCPTAIQAIASTLPTPGEFAARPDEIEYFWRQYDDHIARGSLLRVGYLLANPRGSESNRFVIFQRRGIATIRDASTTNRFAIDEIQRECVDEITPLPDLARAQIDTIMSHVRQDPDTPALEGLMNLPGSYALEQALELDRSVTQNRSHAGWLMTLLGTMARVVGPGGERIRTKAIERMKQSLENGFRPVRTTDGSVSRAGRDDRITLARAAATSLHLAGGPDAVFALADVVQEEGFAPPEVINRFGQTVTAAGFLANDATSILRDAPPTTMACRTISDDTPNARHVEEALREECDDRLVAARLALDEFLRRIALDPRASASNRKSACTGMGLSGSPQAQQGIEDVLNELLRDPRAVDWDLVRPCLVTTPATVSGATRERLWTLADGSYGAGEIIVPENVRFSALVELSETGIDSDARRFVGLYASEQPEVLVELAENRLTLGDEQTMVEELMKCAEDDKRGTDLRIRCLNALTKVDGAVRGEDGVAARVSALASAESLSVTVCGVLASFAERGSRNALEQMKGKCATEKASSEDLEKHVQELLEDEKSEQHGSATEDPLEQEAPALEAPRN